MSDLHLLSLILEALAPSDGSREGSRRALVRLISEMQNDLRMTTRQKDKCTRRLL